MKKLFRSLALLLVMGQAMAQVPTNGLVAYYPFSGDANDATSNSLNGTVNGAVLTNDRFGNANKAYQFNGRTSSIIVNNFPVFFQNGSYALSFWVKSDGVSNSTGDLQCMLAYGNTSADHTFDYTYSYRQNAGNYFNYWDISNSSYYFNPDGAKLKNKWAHIVISYDGTKMYHYVNGVLSYQIPRNQFQARSGRNLIIGGFSSPNQFLNGSMDDIRIYDRALQGSEVIALANENCDPYFTQNQVISFDGNNLSIPSNPGSTYVWTFNGTPISGATSNVYTGTLNAGVYGVTVTNGSCNVNATYTQIADEVNLSKGLNAYYPFNGNANDESGNNINGTVNGAVLTNGINNAQNTAYYFDGTPGSSNISFTGKPTTNVKNWTISTWLKPSDLNQTGFAVMVGADNGSNYGDGYGIGISGRNRLNALYSFIGFYDGKYAFNDITTWHHTVISSDFNGTLRFYVDGVLTNTLTPTTPIVPTNFSIGAQMHNGTITRNFKGSIDEVRVYNRALTSSEIMTLTQQNCSVYFKIAPSVLFDGTNLVSTSYPGAQYAWTYNGNAITGQTSNVFTGTLNAGEYGITITNGECSAIATYTQATDISILTKGLRAYYPFNGDATDASGNGNDGQLDGSPVLSNDPLGQENKAFEFDGSNRILVPNSSSLNVTNGISISTWIKQTGVNAPGYPGAVANYGSVLIDKAVWGTGDGGYRLDARGQSHATGKRMRFILDGNLSEASQDHEINQWQHLVVTYDLNSIKYYLNGIFISEEPVSKSSIIGNNYDLAIGGPNSTGENATGFNFVGSVDEVRIYDRAINSLEVKQLNCEFSPSVSAAIGGNTESCVNSTDYYSLPNASTDVNYEWSVTGGTIEDVNAPVAKVTWTNAGTQTLSLNYTSFCQSGSLSSEINIGSGLACGLELYLPFNGDATDASGNGRDGSVSNGSFDNNRFINSNSSLSLSGNASGVTFNDYNGYKGDGKGSFTIGTWFKAQPNGETRIISNGMNGNAKGYFLGVGANGVIRFALGNEFGDYSDNFYNSVIFNTQKSTYSDNQWHFTAVIVNRDENKIFLWVDGAIEPIALYSNSGGVIQSDNSLDISGLNVSAETSSYLSIGNFQDYGFFKGNIDETKIYSRALNTSEIQSLYTDGCPGFQAPTVSYGSNPYCKIGVVVPTGTFANGSFASDAGLVIDPSTGSIDLAASTGGDYTVTYTIPAQYGCAAQSATASVSITEVTNTTDANSLCANGSSTKSFTGSSSIVTWNVSPASLSGNLSGNVFTAPSEANTVSVYAIDVNGCQSTTVTFEVYGLPFISNGETSVIAGTDLNLTGSNGDSWSIVSGSGTLNSNVLTVGNTPGTSITVRYTNAVSNCFVEKSFQIIGAYATSDASTYDCTTLPFIVPVVVTSPVNSGIIGVDLDLTYDPTIMVPTGNYSIGSVVSDNGQSLTDIRFTSGRIQASIAYADQGSLTGTGEIINFEFTLVPGVVQGAYDLPSGILTESYLLTNKDVEVKAGKLNVLHYYPTLNGKIIFRQDATLPVFNNSNPASGVTTIHASENCVNTGTLVGTDEQGNFNIVMPDKDFTVSINREIPENTSVNDYINAFDGSLVARIANGKISNSGVFDLISADVNGDGRVLSGDRTLIMNRSVLNNSSFPAGSWKFFPKGTTFAPADKNNVPQIASCMEVPSFVQDGCVELVPQTYSSILIGDVDGNYATTPNGANLRTGAAGIVDFANGYYTSNNFFRVPVKVNVDAEVISVDLELNFDTIYTTNAKAVNSTNQSALLVQNLKKNKLLVAVSYNDSVSKKYDALYLDFKTNNLDSLKITYLKFLINGRSASYEVTKIAKVTELAIIDNSTQSMNVYPNPSQSGVFHLDLNNLVSEDGSVEVMDLFGRNIYKSSTSNVNHLTIDLSNVENGTYVMKVKSGNSVKVKSLIVEK